MKRRRILSSIAISLAASAVRGIAQTAAGHSKNADTTEDLAHRLGISLDRLRGFLIGSLLGDALGGPIEFSDPDRLPDDMPHVRHWKAGTKLTATHCKTLARSLRLRGYETLRPETAPFGPWRKRAPAGTITDDSRHKIILLRAIKRTLDHAQRGPVTLDRSRLAAEYLRPLRHKDETAESTAALDHDGFKPYRDAARWWTARSQHAPANLASDPAYPPERLWAGVANCSGQMALLPLAAVFPGKPVAAYEATYAIDFLDSDHAVDFCAAINSGIAEVLSDRHNDSDPNTRIQTLIQTMIQTDPYHYADIPFTERPFAQWLRRGRQWAESADRDPRQLFEKLEQDGKPHYWWDAHFTFVVPLAIMHLCRDAPMAAMNLCLDFGHDTDSYAQLLGAWIGAIHGHEAFPESMVRQVEERLEVDFGESVDDWCQTLLQAADRVHTRQLRFSR
ncbi:ADP-ribosylglycohydrolase [Stieleria neptunia]|uniref:ADP-ribosylglycohydrolase n=1 Tax=Stieleria neptunia TaxID=2527979 RepID=A0A518HRY8_9BACT|nr:ADP-ribosylglycohydrolase family protein [Stieleria neptunia]QDV43613.1 ADP-ribosylglycohydrolase [Stieleria neptunia]